MIAMWLDTNGADLNSLYGGRSWKDELSKTKPALQSGGYVKDDRSVACSVCGSEARPGEVCKSFLSPGYAEKRVPEGAVV